LPAHEIKDKMPRKSRKACQSNGSLTPAKCVFQSSKISTELCKACQPFMLIDKVFGEWTCRICGRQEYGEKRMKKHVSDKHETPLHTCEETSQDSTDTFDDNNNESKLSKSKVETITNENHVSDKHESPLHTCEEMSQDSTDTCDDNNNESKLSKSKVETINNESVYKTPLHTCEETSQDSTDTFDDNNNESKLSKSKVETIINESVFKDNDTESFGAFYLEHDQDINTSIQADKNDDTTISEPEVEPTMKESVDKSFFQPSNISADSCMACQPYILIDKVFGEATCRICTRQEYGEKRMKKHIKNKHKTLPHICGKLKEKANQNCVTPIQDDTSTDSKLSESKNETIETETVDKNAGTELLEVTDKDLTSLVQGEENNESKLSEQKVEPVKMDAVDKVDTESFEGIELVHDKSSTSLKANGNDVSKREWQIVEISPTKKYFCKKSKSLKTKKEPKQNINPDKPEGSQVKNPPISNLEQLNVDLMPFKTPTPISPIHDLEQMNMDLMQSKQGSQVKHNPVSNLGQLNVDLMQSKPIQSSLKMDPIITLTRLSPPRVNFSEVSPKEESKKLMKRKSTFSSLPTEKRFKIKPKPWEYDATELVNKILEAKETNTDENNNSANDNDD